MVDVMNFVNEYWWAILIAVIILIIAVLIRSGIISSRLKSLFSWPPSP